MARGGVAVDIHQCSGTEEEGAGRGAGVETHDGRIQVGVLDRQLARGITSIAHGDEVQTSEEDTELGVCDQAATGIDGGEEGMAAMAGGARGPLEGPSKGVTGVIGHDDAGGEGKHQHDSKAAQRFDRRDCVDVATQPVEDDAGKDNRRGGHAHVLAPRAGGAREDIAVRLQAGTVGV